MQHRLIFAPSTNSSRIVAMVFLRWEKSVFVIKQPGTHTQLHEDESLCCCCCVSCVAALLLSLHTW